jgi:hypothetical protein
VLPSGTQSDDGVVSSIPRRASLLCMLTVVVCLRDTLSTAGALGVVERSENRTAEVVAGDRIRNQPPCLPLRR